MAPKNSCLVWWAPETLNNNWSRTAAGIYYMLASTVNFQIGDESPRGWHNIILLRHSYIQLAWYLLLTIAIKTILNNSQRYTMKSHIWVQIILKFSYLVLCRLLFELGWLWILHIFAFTYELPHCRTKKKKHKSVWYYIVAVVLNLILHLINSFFYSFSV